MPQFSTLARFYDPLQTRKDYGSESRRLEKLVHRFGRAGGRDWLDTACGTGQHLSHLRARYAVVGVDLSPEMLRIARHRLPGVPLYQADMRTFRLGSSFDVVTCLFGAIGHLKTERDLLRSFTNFFRHLKPGGIAIVEPWLGPEIYRSGFIHLVTHQSPGLTIVRLSDSSRRRNHSIVHFHYLIAERGRRVRYVDTVDVGLMVSRLRLLDLLRRAGFSARFIPHGPTPGRGLLVGCRPTTG
jgi:SAM-dependent methyltransferase